MDAQPHQLKSAQARLEAETGKAACTLTLQRGLKKSGYSFKRARHSLTDRRDEAAFRETDGLLGALEQAEARGELTLHYVDESGFSQRSALPYAWSSVGRPLRLPAFSHSRRLTVLGLYSRQEGVCTRTTTERITTAEVIAAFEDWMAQPPREKPAVVVLDNAALHRSARFQRQREQWMAQHVYVLYLPPYSPALNRIEGLWRQIKYQWLPIHAYRTFETLGENVRTVLATCASSYQAICV